mmetsp:Transcript_1949/g.2365  ORF Transcript_1949/g.2365 Transcript_1949/m.2365 type:complete len:624 (+) Transcript_1949:268-2139(+)
MTSKNRKWSDVTENVDRCIITFLSDEASPLSDGSESPRSIVPSSFATNQPKEAQNFSLNKLLIPVEVRSDGHTVMQTLLKSLRKRSVETKHIRHGKEHEQLFLCKTSQRLVYSIQVCFGSEVHQATVITIRKGKGSSSVFLKESEAIRSAVHTSGGNHMKLLPRLSILYKPLDETDHELVVSSSKRLKHSFLALSSENVSSTVDINKSTDSLHKSTQKNENKNSKMSGKAGIHLDTQPHHQNSFSPKNTLPNKYVHAVKQDLQQGLKQLLHTEQLQKDQVTSSSVKPKTGTDTGKINIFPLKLMEILNKEDQSIISFLPKSDAFEIKDGKRLLVEILPKYFSHTKLESFRRQINLYGFRRITAGPNAGAYRHELFKRDQPDLCQTMKRSTLNKKKIKNSRSDSTPRLRSCSLSSQKSGYLISDRTPDSGPVPMALEVSSEGLSGSVTAATDKDNSDGFKNLKQHQGSAAVRTLSSFQTMNKMRTECTSRTTGLGFLSPDEVDKTIIDHTPHHEYGAQSQLQASATPSSSRQNLRFKQNRAMELDLVDMELFIEEGLTEMESQAQSLAVAGMNAHITKGRCDIQEQDEDTIHCSQNVSNERDLSISIKQSAVKEVFESWSKGID